MAKYININGAFFDNSSGSLAAVNDPAILRGLKAGTIASTAQSSLGTSQVSNTVATPTLLPQAAQQQISQGNYNLSPTSTYNSGLPSTNPTPGIGGGLNTGSTSPTNLVSFKNALASVMDLAQQKRNTNMQAFMGTPGFQGTLMASDFNTLFSQMNKQGDVNSKYAAQDVVDKMTPAEPKVLGSATEGYYTFNPTTGETKAISNPNGPVGGNDNNLTTTMPSKEVTKAKAALNASKFSGAEADGKYVDPQLYLDNYESWVGEPNNGSPEEFFKNFPPSTYINPNNTWLPPEIMKFVPKPKTGEGSTRTL